MTPPFSREPHWDTKVIIVGAIQKIRPHLQGRIEPHELEAETFNSADYPRSGAVEKFDVDFLVERIDSIVRTSQGRPELVNRLLGISIEDAKEQFWFNVRPLLEKLRISDKRFNETLLEVGPPPELPLPPSGSNKEYAERLLKNPRMLSQEQQLVWKVAKAIYPPFTHDSYPGVKKPARYMAKFWDRAIIITKARWDFSIASEFALRKPGEKPTVYLLCWLEPMLATQCGDSNPGKTGLFELGRHFHTDTKLH